MLTRNIILFIHSLAKIQHKFSHFLVEWYIRQRQWVVASVSTERDSLDFNKVRFASTDVGRIVCDVIFGIEALDEGQPED
jgi:hypothetical protein